MKMIFPFLVLNLIHGMVFSQKKPADGIYLIDQSKQINSADPQNKRAVIQFNEFFVDETPDDYEPLVIATGDYVPLELAKMPVIKKDKLQKKVLSVQLTDNATKKLTEFTTNIRGKYVVIVVNGEALTIHEIKHPVTFGLLQLSAKGSGCDQVYTFLKKRVKA